MKDFRLAAHKTSMSYGIFVQFFGCIDVGQICILYRKLYIVYSSIGRGGYQATA
jgi:hypothetical protein